MTASPSPSDPVAPAAPVVPVSRAGAYLALAAGAIALGISPVFVRLADVGPFASAFWRALLALPVLFLWMRIEDRGRPDRPGPTLAVGLAGLFFAGDLFFWHLSILNTTIANSTFLATTAPVWVILVAWLWFRDRISGSTVAGLALCLAGGAALLGDSLQVDRSRLVGDAYGLATGVFFGLYFHAVRAGRATHGAARLTFQSSAVTAAVLFVIAVALEPRILPQTMQGWLAVLALGMLTHAAGQGLLSVALGTLPTIFSSLVIFLEAVIAAVFAWAVLGEALTLTQVAGGASIMLGIWVARPR